MRVINAIALLCLMLPAASANASDGGIVLSDAKKPSCLNIPSAFSPNDDCAGCDRFNITSSCPVSYYSIEIFDRSGAKVFEAHNIKDRWDGSVGTSFAPVGCYTYSILYRSEADSAVAQYKGMVLYLH